MCYQKPYIERWTENAMVNSKRKKKETRTNNDLQNTTQKI